MSSGWRAEEEKERLGDYLRGTARRGLGTCSRFEAKRGGFLGVYGT